MLRLHKSIFLLLLVFGVFAMPSISQAQMAVGISVHVGPPALPVYVQPVCPGPGYLWTPGYWAYGPDGYYWVPGTWVMPPQVGFLWTPGYWGWGGGVYLWHPGYWGHHVGFYGGINYGFGYTGVGFAGGEWRGREFHYNTAVTNVNTTIIHNTYHTTVINNTTINRVSYNGGHGGINARPTHAEMQVEHEHHYQPTSMQTQHEHGARQNREFLASENHGHPAMAATSRPGEFHGERGGAARHEDSRGKPDRPSNNMNNSNRGAERNDRPSNAHGKQAESSNANFRHDTQPQHGNSHVQNPQHENTQQPGNSHAGSPQHENRPQPANGHSGNPHQNNERSNGHQGEGHSGGGHGEGKPSH
jgi:hypothetical protein